MLRVLLLLLLPVVIATATQLNSHDGGAGSRGSGAGVVILKGDLKERNSFIGDDGSSGNNFDAVATQLKRRDASGVCYRPLFVCLRASCCRRLPFGKIPKLFLGFG